MLATFATFPIGKGESVSSDVARVIKIIRESGISYQLTPMATIIEGEWDDVMDVIKRCHHVLKENSDRVYTTITIDDRKGHDEMMKTKIESLKEKLGEV
ncbi:MAG: MTH1187 family thiamine-binding protein [Candidatus Eremiobacteraeota bacterium]|nr:MTH1187 family thiamine-binding protein [Candidatus Eremiobacteraeota bacterium]